MPQSLVRSFNVVPCIRGLNLSFISLHVLDVLAGFATTYNHTLTRLADVTQLKRFKRVVAQGSRVFEYVWKGSHPNVDSAPLIPANLIASWVEHVEEMLSVSTHRCLWIESVLRLPAHSHCYERRRCSH